MGEIVAGKDETIIIKMGKTSIKEVALCKTEEEYKKMQGEGFKDLFIPGYVNIDAWVLYKS